VRVSVEISTYNRREMLRSVLERLARQTYPFGQFEVLISDDGSTDDTTEMVAAMKKSMPYAIRYFRHNKRNIGVTHNLGIKEARGEIVLMLANDILAEPRLLEEHMRSHEENPDSRVVVVGALRQSPELTKTAFQRGWNVVINTLFAGNLKKMGCPDFLVSNLSFKKDFMISEGMFREWPAGSHEDLELRYRLMQNGMKLVKNPEALGYHHHEEDIASISARAYMHGFNWHYFEENVPDLWIRSKSGNIRLSDGKGLYIKALVKKVLQRVLLNHITISYLLNSLAKAAEHLSFIEFMMPFLIAKISSYNFQRGLRDYKKKPDSTYL